MDHGCLARGHRGSPFLRGFGQCRCGWAGSAIGGQWPNVMGSVSVGLGRAVLVWTLQGQCWWALGGRCWCGLWEGGVSVGFGRVVLVWALGGQCRCGRCVLMSGGSCDAVCWGTGPPPWPVPFQKTDGASVFLL